MVKKRVRGSRTGRPIMVLLDLLGRRWALRLIWELREEPKRFRALQESIGASPTIINTRLSELREAKLVELDPEFGLPAHGAGPRTAAGVPAAACLVGEVDGYLRNGLSPERARRRGGNCSLR